MRRLSLFIQCLGAAAVLSAVPCFAADKMITKHIAADACEDLQSGERQNAVQKRAEDKAGITAVKMSGVIQSYDENLSPSALDVVAYQLLDDYLSDVKSEVTLADGDRICIKFAALLEVSEPQLKSFITTYKDSDNLEAVAEIAEKIKEETFFKPQKVNEKQLVYLAPMRFWNGVETTRYTEFLTELLSHSEYYYVTDNEDVADFVVRPQLQKSAVDEIDDKNHKMQMLLEMQVIAPNLPDFDAFTEQQNHFILFAADKDEQEIADTLIRKLSTRAATEIKSKINKYSQTHLEDIKLRGKK